MGSTATKSRAPAASQSASARRRAGASGDHARIFGSGSARMASARFCDACTSSRTGSILAASFGAARAFSRSVASILRRSSAPCRMISIVA